MKAPPLPAGLVRSLGLLSGATLAVLVAWPVLLPLIATSDLASVTWLVGGSGIIAWAAARVSCAAPVKPAGAFAANDNDHDFSGSLPQFISE